IVQVATNHHGIAENRPMAGEPSAEDGVVQTYAGLAARILRRPPRCGGTRLVAIDGPGGAGKSVLAERLARSLDDAPIVHTDDFASWENPHDWWDRFEAHVLRPLERSEPARYRRYDWERRTFGASVEIPPRPVVIVEGVS